MNTHTLKVGYWARFPHSRTDFDKRSQPERGDITPDLKDGAFPDPFRPVVVHWKVLEAFSQDRLVEAGVGESNISGRIKAEMLDRDKKAST